MSEIDDLLQKQLEALERGETLESVLAELPDVASDLGPLISLASSLRSMPHPKPQAQISNAWVQGANRQPAAVSLFQKMRPAWNWSRVVMASGIAGAAVILLVAAISVIGLSLWFGGPRAAQVATLMDVNGVVGVGPLDSNEGWELVSEGMQVREGQRIRTGADGNVTLVFFEGTRSTLGPDTDLTLVEVGGGWNETLKVALDQHAGDSIHSVVPLQGKRSAYQVDTPSGTVTVWGTVFEVSVAADGKARVVVERGKVQVSGQEDEVLLEAGQATTAQAGALGEPAYWFEIAGIVSEIEGEFWTVGGVSFKVTAETEVKGDPEVGSYVKVEGRILDDGTRVADEMKVILGDGEQSTFTGEVEVMGEGEWLISGKTVLVDAETDYDEEIQVGDSVKVTFIVMNDMWLALRIELLEEEAPQPEESESPEDTEAPLETEVPAETETPEVATACTGADPQPKGQTLADDYGVTYEEIMGWFCQRFGFGEIELAYSLSGQHGIPVEQIFAMRSTGSGWGQIKKELKNVTPVPTEPPVEEPTEAQETPEPAESQAQEAAGCGGGKAQATGQRTARQLGVPFNEVMGWYCQGYDFNEISTAYRLSWGSGGQASVGQILSWRSQGMNWGQIRKQLQGPAQPAEKAKPKPTKKPK